MFLSGPRILCRGPKGFFFSLNSLYVVCLFSNLAILFFVPFQCLFQLFNSVVVFQFQLQCIVRSVSHCSVRFIFVSVVVRLVLVSTSVYRSVGVPFKCSFQFSFSYRILVSTSVYCSVGVPFQCSFQFLSVVVRLVSHFSVRFSFVSVSFSWCPISVFISVAFQLSYFSFNFSVLFGRCPNFSVRFSVRFSFVSVVFRSVSHFSVRVRFSFHLVGF